MNENVLVWYLKEYLLLTKQIATRLSNLQKKLVTKDKIK
jgi:hypothetical protein